MSQEVKVYKIDDYSWYAACSLDEAINKMLEETGIERSDLEGFSAPHELNDAEMQKTMMGEHDLVAPYEPITFRRALDLMIEQGKEFPRFFASTEC